MAAGNPSFYGSPAEAQKAPPEELLYLACLHEGTGVDAPDFLAVLDAEEGRIVHETPMPNVGDELHHFGWNRCSSACHGPDRSHLIVPGFRSSRIHVLNVADDPRRPAIEKVIEPGEIAEKTGYTRPHTVHCMPGENIVISMLGDRDGRGAGGFAVLDAQTFEVKGRWEDGGERPGLNTTSGTSRARTSSSPRSSASPTPTSAASTPATWRPAAMGAGCTSGASGSGGCSRRSTSATRASCHSRCAGCTTPRPTRASS
ncbi:MAG TPA: selenium-binding protein SBP56-related protein, partial [Solirubrobacteraceae bacterium]